MHIGFVPFELEHANISNQSRYIPVETGHIADIAEPMRLTLLDRLRRSGSRRLSRTKRTCRGRRRSEAIDPARTPGACRRRLSFHTAKTQTGTSCRRATSAVMRPALGRHTGPRPCRPLFVLAFQPGGLRPFLETSPEASRLVTNSRERSCQHAFIAHRSSGEHCG